MSHFYGRIEGSRGEVVGAGTAGSGYRAWAQNYTGRVVVDLVHSTNGRDYAEVRVDASTLNYGGGGALVLGRVDLSALVDQAGDPGVRRHIERARAALEAANARACKLAKVVNP